jgi:DNA polymerase III delta subunit
MAVPNPEDELTRLTRLLAKGLPPLVLITGAADFFRAAATDRALAAVPQAAELRVIDAVAERGGGDGDGDGDGPREGDDGEDDGGAGASGESAGLASCPELQDLRGGGLFARTAFVVVRRGGGWWKQHAATVATQLPHFGKGCGLVVEASKLDKRRKVVAGLVKAQADAGALFEFRDLYDQPYDRSRSPLEGELCKWIQARARQLGVPLQPDAAWLLVMQVGKVPAELLAELQRLGDRLGADPKRQPLAPADLRGKLTCSFESTPFEFAEAVLGDDRRAAWRSLRAMFDRGVRQKDGKAMDSGGLLPFTTAWLFQQLAARWQGRQLLDGGVAPREVAAAVGVHLFPERFTAQVQALPRTRLRRGLLALHSCQRASRLTGEDADALLERFLAQWFDGAPIPTAEDLEL